VEIHWVGGNLPQVGKAWAVRALTESLFLQNPQISPVVVDTSPESPLSQVYNPGLLESYTPSSYFTGDRLASDEIVQMVYTYQKLVVKLSSHTQAAFLDWAEASGILDEDIRHDFWFVSNGNRRSLEYFMGLQRDDWHLHFVRNQYQRVWDNVGVNDEKSPFDLRNLSGIITNPAEIESIEMSGATLLELSQPEALHVPLLTRVRIQRFLKYSCDSLLGDRQQKQLTLVATPNKPVPLFELLPEEEDEDEDIPL
jgi:hypothetical protein